MTPFICPVCNGKGLVPNGFYRAVGSNTWSATSIDPEKCRSCWGSGIVWAGKKEEFPNELVEKLSDAYLNTSKKESE